MGTYDGYGTTYSTATTDTTWCTWNNSTTGTATTAQDQGYIWIEWNTTTGTTCQQTTWTTWVTRGSTNPGTANEYTWYEWNGTNMNPIQGEAAEPELIPYRRTNPLDRMGIVAGPEATEAYAKIERKRAKAEDKAKRLLADLIGEDQLKVYERTGRVFVRGKDADYIIRRDGYVMQITKDKVTDLCVHLANRTAYPATDNVIGLMLALECDEQQITAKANRHGVQPRGAVAIPEAACQGGR